MHMFNAFKCEMFTSLVSQSRENEIRHCIVGGNGGRVGCEHILPHTAAMQAQCSCPTSPLSGWTSVGSGWLLFPFATPASRISVAFWNNPTEPLPPDDSTQPGFPASKMLKTWLMMRILLST